MAKLLIYPFPIPCLSPIIIPVLSHGPSSNLMWCWRGGNCFVGWTWHLVNGVIFVWNQLYCEGNLPKELKKMNKRSHRRSELENQGHLATGVWTGKSRTRLLPPLMPWLCSLTSLHRAASAASCGWPLCDFSWHIDWLQLWHPMTFGSSPSINRLTQSLSPNANALGRRIGSAGP